MNYSRSILLVEDKARDEKLAIRALAKNQITVLPGFPGGFSLGKNAITTMTAPKNAGKPSCGRFDRKAARAGARRSPPCSF